tara:strand:+ start:1688 stop:1849 length:162 start_codon:yes stop_codon:yes gene_type:complete
MNETTQPEGDKTHPSRATLDALAAIEHFKQYGAWKIESAAEHAEVLRLLSANR